MAAPKLDYIAEGLRPLAVKIDSVAVDPANAMGHPDENLEAIRGSLAKYGQRKPIVVNRNDNVIEAGNGTWEAAKALGWTHIAAVFVADDPATATGYAIADNRTAQLATWDYEALARVLDEAFEEPTEIPGVSEAFLAEVMEEADLIAQVADMLGGGAPKSKPTARRLGDKKKQIRPVLYVDELSIFEQALRATGEANRGKALLTVCAFFLMHDETRQQHISPEDSAPQVDDKTGESAGGAGDTRGLGEDLDSLLQASA